MNRPAYPRAGGHRPAPESAPGADVRRAEVTEVLPASDGALAPLSRLGKAMEAVKAKLTVIDQFGRDVVDLIANNPKDRKYDLTTKAGEKECDDARKTARTKRLAIQNAWAEGKAVLKGLGEDLKVAAEKDIEVLQAIEDNAKTQLEAKTKAETERKERHEKGIAFIKGLAVFDGEPSSETVAERMKQAEAVIVDDSYEEFRKKADEALRETRDTLTAAFTAAVAREQAAEAERLRQAALQAALEAAREKEERTTRTKAKIETIKRLPEQCEGTGAESIREILRLHKAAVPDAEHFGDMLEFAEMAHELTARKLQEMLDLAVVDEAGAASPFDATPRDVVVPLDSTPLRDVDTIDDDKERHLGITTTLTGTEVLKRQNDPVAYGCASAPRVDGNDNALEHDQPKLRFDEEAAMDGMRGIVHNIPDDHDPFSDLPPVTATTHTVPPGRVGAPEPRTAPAPRGTWKPAGTPAPTSAPAPATDKSGLEDGVVPDLLAAAKDFIQKAEAEGGFGFFPAPLDGAYANLKAAVDFISEFAD